MCIAHPSRPFNRPTVTGLRFLLFANLANVWARFPWGFSSDTIDASRGLLFGIAIASLVLGIWRRSHDGCTLDNRSA